MAVKVLFLVLLGIFSRTDASSWGYAETNGPDTWGEDYETCGQGLVQSPVDLVASADGDFGDLNFAADWHEDIEGELYDNGHTVEFEVAQPNGHTVTGGPFGEEEFQLAQLHFHWGSDNEHGSEHFIGGRQFPMEMHMVHINSKYVGTDGTLDATYSTAPDSVAVLGFVFDVVSAVGANDYAPLDNVMGGIGLLSNGVVGEDKEEIHLNLGAFIDSVIDGGYFSYEGSFTTPACNEVVTWVNFAKPIMISESQIETYRTLLDSDGNELADNFRPVQDLNGRTISFTKGSGGPPAPKGKGSSAQ